MWIQPRVWTRSPHYIPTTNSSVSKKFFISCTHFIFFCDFQTSWVEWKFALKDARVFNATKLCSRICDTGKVFLFWEAKLHSKKKSKRNFMIIETTYCVHFHCIFFSFRSKIIRWLCLILDKELEKQITTINTGTNRNGNRQKEEAPKEQQNQIDGKRWNGMRSDVK